MLGPVVDIELVDPPDRVPLGVEFGIKHFLTVPNSLETQEAVEKASGADHRHYIIKLTKRKGKHELEEIDFTTNISSEYFTTTKFAGRPLCKISSAWFPWGDRHECSHSSLKKIVITKKKTKCPHEDRSLYLWCVCKASEKEFEKAIEERGEEKTTVIKTFNLEPSSKLSYKISVFLSGKSEAVGDERWTSHWEMCRRNGIMDLETLDQRSGYIQRVFECGCQGNEPQHCDRAQPFEIKIEKESQRKELSERAVRVVTHETDIDSQIPEQQLGKSDEVEPNVGVLHRIASLFCCQDNEPQHCIPAELLTISKVEKKRGERPLVKVMTHKTDIDCQIPKQLVKSDEVKLSVGLSDIHLVERHLGSESLKHIVDYCTGGKMSDDAMAQFAERLGRDESRPNVIYGNHRTRMSSNSQRSRGCEIESILRDWWTQKLHLIPRSAALEKLVQILDKTDGCRPLASELKKILERGAIMF